MRALPLYGNSAFSKSADSAPRFSTVLIARDSARASPARNRSIQGWRLGFKLFSVEQRREDGKPNMLAEFQLGSASDLARRDEGKSHVNI